jgi:hypothetical protein
MNKINRERKMRQIDEREAQPSKFASAVLEKFISFAFPMIGILPPF